jgi:aminoglycoside 3-N-acetyltransferase I
LDPEIKILQQSDIDEFNELISVFEKVFNMEFFEGPDQSHLVKLLNEKHFFAVVALVEKKVIAGLTAYVLDQYYSEKPLAYIYDLAVMTEHQRKGIGKKLIEFTIRYCRQKGFEEIFVQADKVDDYAIDFYRSTQPTDEEQVVHFYYKLPGVWHDR